MALRSAKRKSGGEDESEKRKNASIEMLENTQSQYIQMWHELYIYIWDMVQMYAAIWVTTCAHARPMQRLSLQC